MSDPTAYRDMAELLIVAAGLGFAAMNFIWLKRSDWLREKQELTRAHEAATAESEERHKVEMRELDAFNAAERRRLENRINELEAQLGIMVKVLSDHGFRVPSVSILTGGGDATIAGDVTGHNKTTRS